MVSVSAYPFLMVCIYGLLMHAMALANIRRAFLFNDEFEDHSEHVYAQFVKEHPEWVVEYDGMPEDRCLEYMCGHIEYI